MSLAFPEPQESKPLTIAISDEKYPTTPMLTIIVGPLDTWDDVLRKYEDALRQQEGTAA